MKKTFEVRLKHNCGTNTTVRISNKALRAMIDLAKRMLAEGEIYAFSVEAVER